MRGALKDTRVDAGLRSCRQSLALINAQSLNLQDITGFGLLARTIRSRLTFSWRANTWRGWKLDGGLPAGLIL
jgi:hypothetical protein